MITTSGNTIVVSGAVEFDSAINLGVQLEDLMAKNPKGIVCDMMGVTVMSSMGVASMLHSLKQGTRITYHIKPDSITHRFLEIANITDLFDIEWE